MVGEADKVGEMFVRVICQPGIVRARAWCLRPTCDPGRLSHCNCRGG